ncbi:MAG: signal recognition particle-docking protein FtsY [Holosporaceae bacterium]|nr:signal recognition particle-docking protein FtsY [Holosporaceae bacterium]
MEFFDKIKNALKKTADQLSLSVTGKKPDENFIHEIEEALIRADVGAATAAKLAGKIADKKFSRETTEKEIRRYLADEICTLLKPFEGDFFRRRDPRNLRPDPEIILVIGVNGNGKTTTVAKIARMFKAAGRNPLLTAGDTFREAATEQLVLWAEKIGVDVYVGKKGADPAGVVYDALKQSGPTHDAVLIDTAGRMQNRGDLLDELEKIKRVIKKIDESAPHLTVLVLDGVTGQAAHSQAETFLRKIGIDGIIVTKLDGTAKGGALISLAEKYKIPILAVGIGEGPDDLKPFDAETYSNALLDVDR